MPVGEAIARCEELRRGKPRRPRARRRDHALPGSALRDGRPLRRGARVRPAQQPGARPGQHADSDPRSSQVIAAVDARELAGDRAGAERELRASGSSCATSLGGMPEGRGMGTACHLAHLYCDDGRWDDAEECLAFYRGTSRVRATSGPLRTPLPSRRGLRRTAASTTRRWRSRSALVELAEDARTAQHVGPASGSLLPRCSGGRPRGRGRRRRRDGARALRAEGQRRRGRSLRAGRRERVTRALLVLRERDPEHESGRSCTPVTFALRRPRI